MNITFIIGGTAVRHKFFGQAMCADSPDWSGSEKTGKVLFGGEIDQDALPAVADYVAAFDGVYIAGDAGAGERRGSSSLDRFFAVIDDCLINQCPLRLAINDPLAFFLVADPPGASAPTIRRSRLADWRQRWRQLATAAPRADWNLQIGLNTVTELGLLPEGEDFFQALLSGGETGAMKSGISPRADERGDGAISEISLIFLAAPDAAGASDPLRNLFVPPAELNLKHLAEPQIVCLFPGAVWIASDADRWLNQ